jgi:hypothetical protein
MPLITTLQEERERFEKEFPTMYSQDKIAIKSFLTQSHIRLLESLKEELPKEKETYTFENQKFDMWEKGYNECLSTIHQLINNAIKSI